jgi:hypothetical protein
MSEERFDSIVFGYKIDCEFVGTGACIIYEQANYKAKFCRWEYRSSGNFYWCHMKLKYCASKETNLLFWYTSCNENRTEVDQHF